MLLHDGHHGAVLLGAVSQDSAQHDDDVHVIIVLFCLPLAMRFFADTFFPNAAATPMVKAMSLTSPFAAAFAVPMRFGNPDLPDCRELAALFFLSRIFRDAIGVNVARDDLAVQRSLASGGVMRFRQESAKTESPGTASLGFSIWHVFARVDSRRAY